MSSLIDRRRESTTFPNKHESRPSLSPGAGHAATQDSEEPSSRPQVQSTATQTTGVDSSSAATDSNAVEPTPAGRKEYIMYTKGVQTDPSTDAVISADDEDDVRFRSRRRSSRRDQDGDEEIRASLRTEIEEELRATQNGVSAIEHGTRRQRFPLRTLDDNELNAVTGSTAFVSFVERSSRVIERALDEEYDLLADYTGASALTADQGETSYTRGSKKAYSLQETLQLFSDRYSRRRMISDIQFSPHFNELLLTAYTKNPSAPNESPGQVLLWNVHAPSRPEYVFTSGSDVLSARFSPFHPNLVIGGCYSGQICLWDTRSPSTHPIQRTPQSGSHLGHTHPVYNISIIGTPNAHNILTSSMDGIVCSWSFDMLTQAQEYLVLHTPPPAKTEDLAPTAMSFPSSDPTFFIVGTEEGSIYPCHRYDRAGAKAGVDNRFAYRGHSAPVMSTHFHPTRGPVDLGDILLSSSSDWSMKLWHVKPAASSTVSSSSSAAAASLTGPSGNQPLPIAPILDIGREDLVYDAKWHPYKPSVFAAVTGVGDLEIFNLLYDLEVPVARASPTRGRNGVMPFKGLNRVCWEERRGSSVAVGGLDGVVTLFETGRGLQGGNGGVGVEEWMGVKRLVGRLEGKGS